ncbi:TolC family protein [Pseudomonas sp. BP8]|uniref:TolC family protein n=1 Tax=Pseudomonas sp. BP8 TaxID=2817864 RepID=UPI001AE1F97E|nr:TolC family protein [Pseudomonas sp. BP8]MBP2262200.1 outer membrane protein [Pseudomonas sp. BP8]HDS1733128.1 TolC family protein [Pseudomonas putida]
MSTSASLFSLLLLLCGWTQVADGLELFAVEDGELASLSGGSDSQTWGCGQTQLPSQLTLEAMIARVLCHDPQIRQTWAEAMAHSAQIGVAKAAYLPRLDASTTLSRAYSDTHYTRSSDHSNQGRKRQIESRLDLSWVLFDFGRREAGLSNAQQLLIAANANQESSLQAALMQAAQLYYAALAAQDGQRAAQEVTKLAAENLKDASAKYEAGAAALSDYLQANTAYTQARLSEVRGQGALREAMGQIALRMGLPPQTTLTLASQLARRPDPTFVKGLDALFEQARSDHPSLIAAHAKRDAAHAAVKERQAAGRPSLSFTASLSDVRTRQTMDYYGDSHARNNSVGLQLTIPLFDGFESAYQVEAARARLQSYEADLANTQQQVSLELWSSYQSLLVETQALNSTADWVQQATLALQVVKGRYRSGVGSMIELLNASSAYAAAEQQHISTLNSWHIARLRLAASLGCLGFWVL